MVGIVLCHKEQTGRCNMKMKFKSTTKQGRALLYRRFIGLEKSINLTSVYNTISDGKFWTFDNETLSFSEIDSTLIPTLSKIVQVQDFNSILQYLTTYFQYTGLAWQTIDNIGENKTLLSASFNNVGKYQTNKYYYCGSFDFMIKGSIAGTNTQYIKGNIIPLKSFNIKHFNDDINLSQDDLVVIDKQLFSVENPEVDHKHQPKDYSIYFATLNSIL